MGRELGGLRRTIGAKHDGDGRAQLPFPCDGDDPRLTTSTATRIPCRELHHAPSSQAHRPINYGRATCAWMPRSVPCPERASVDARAVREGPGRRSRTSASRCRARRPRSDAVPAHRGPRRRARNGPGGPPSLGQHLRGACQPRSAGAPCACRTWTTWLELRLRRGPTHRSTLEVEAFPGAERASGLRGCARAEERRLRRPAGLSATSTTPTTRPSAQEYHDPRRPLLHARATTPRTPATAATGCSIGWR